MKMLKRLLSQLHRYVLWLLISVFLWSFVVSRITDIRPEDKVTLVIDAEEIDAAGLSEALESALPSGLRLVEVRPASYYLMQQGEAYGADLYVVRASEVQDGAEAYLLPEGTRCFDAATGIGAALQFIRFDGGEDRYLCYGAASVHLEDGAAEAVARRFLALE